MFGEGGGGLAAVAHERDEPSVNYYLAHRKPTIEHKLIARFNYGVSIENGLNNILLQHN